MSDNSYLENILKIREQTNHFFKYSDESPLTATQKQSFIGLSYFSVDEHFNLKIDLQKDENPEEVTILATKGDERRYLHYGFFEFTLKDTINRLTVYQSLEKDYLFVPFKDRTSGTESYGGGRYVEIESLNDRKFRIDFNLAYLPYCAYNDKYSCTLVPPENFLEVRIPAGQMNYS
ncbi:MAG: DUF1684 domain-containing protein [Candidatus Hodarchaeales archaeon]|jgi:uncharacterized protein (DUF1684 family)